MAQGTGTGTAYGEGRASLGELLGGLTAEQAEQPVPACPDWTVRQTLAHLVGVCDDLAAGRMDGVATDPWTDAQVRARDSASMADLIAEWDRLAPPLEAMADETGDLMAQWVFDLVVHEQDLREALGAPGGTGTARAEIAIGWIRPHFEGALAAKGVALDLGADDAELLRIATGRRSAESVATAVAAAGGTSDVATVREALTWGPFRPPA